MRAHRRLSDHGFGNVELVHGEARATKLTTAGFDLVTARLVLADAPRPEAIVAEAVRLARPGGVVAFLENDQLFVGSRLPQLLRDAGLVEVRVRPFVQAWGRKPG